MAFQLPDVGIFLDLPVLALHTLGSSLGFLQLLVAFAALGFGLVGPLVGSSQLGFQGVHTGFGVGALAAQIIQLGLKLAQLFLVFQFVLLGFVGERVHVRQDIIFIEAAKHTGAESLLLYVHGIRWHGVLHPLAENLKDGAISCACSGC